MSGRTLDRALRDCAAALIEVADLIAREERERAEAEARAAALTANGPIPLAVSQSEAARLLGCHRNSIRRRVVAGDLTPVMVAGMARIPMAQIRALVEAPPPRVRIARRTRGAT